MRYQYREKGKDQWNECNQSLYEFCKRSPDHRTRKDAPVCEVCCTRDACFSIQLKDTIAMSCGTIFHKGESLMICGECTERLTAEKVDEGDHLIAD